MKQTKNFPTLAILGAYSGYVLEETGKGIEDVFLFFWPEIGPYGMCFMADRIDKELLKQYPRLAELPECTRETIHDYIKIALDKFGDELSLREL